jgi:hypothetical protein
MPTRALFCLLAFALAPILASGVAVKSSPWAGNYSGNFTGYTTSIKGTCSCVVTTKDRGTFSGQIQNGPAFSVSLTIIETKHGSIPIGRATIVISKPNYLVNIPCVFQHNAVVGSPGKSYILLSGTGTSRYKVGKKFVSDPVYLSLKTPVSG